MKLFYLTLYFLVLLKFSIADWDGDCNDTPEYLNSVNCCKEDLFNYDDEYETSLNCLEKFNITDDYATTPESAQMEVCFYDCLYNANQWIINGTIDVNKVASNKGDFSNIPELGNIYKNAVQKCSDDMNEILKRIENNPIHKRYIDGQCSPIAFVLHDCAMLEYLKNCPAEYWSKENSDCEDIEPYIKKCQF